MITHIPLAHIVQVYNGRIIWEKDIQTGSQQKIWDIYRKRAIIASRTIKANEAEYKLLDENNNPYSFTLDGVDYF